MPRRLWWRDPRHQDVAPDGRYVSVRTSTYVMVQAVPRHGGARLRVELLETAPRSPTGLVALTSEELVAAWSPRGVARVSRSDSTRRCDPAPGADRCAQEGQRPTEVECVAVAELRYGHETTAWCRGEARRVLLLESSACGGACTGAFQVLLGDRATCVGTCSIDAPLPGVLDAFTGESLDTAECARTP